MLQVGLTGGIGSGKSTVAARLVERGAVLVDADRIAREVVEPGSDGLEAVVAAFGAGVLGPGGGLDRPALAAVVFSDADARQRLNAIVHPRVRARSQELVAAAPSDAVLVQDVPLLVEGGMAAHFALVVIVHADVEERVRRLVGSRGMPEQDARARIAAQAGDDARRAVADVWLDNSGAAAELVAAVDALWDERLVPFEENVRLRRVAQAGAPRIVEPDPRWTAAGTRLAARVAVAVGSRGRGVAHIGPTAVPGLPAEDVIDLQLGVQNLADADSLRDALVDAGFPAGPEIDDDSPERNHGSADPGRRAQLYVREVGSPGWRNALLFRDWLRAEPDVRAEYPVAAVDGAHVRAEAWAATSGWAPSLP